MKRLENGNLFSIEIFNGNLFNTEDRTRNISFEKKLRVFSEDYINEKNPVAQDVILKDSVQVENIDLFVQLFFQNLMNSMSVYRDVIRIPDLLKETFDIYLKKKYTDDELSTIEIDNTPDLERVKDAGLYLLKEIFLNKKYNFSEKYFRVKDRTSYSYTYSPVEFKDFYINFVKEEFSGKGNKFKHLRGKGYLLIDKKKKEFTVNIWRENDNEYIFYFPVAGYTKRYLIVLTFNMSTNTVNIKITEGRGNNVKKYFRLSSIESVDITEIFLANSIMKNSTTGVEKLTKLSGIF